MAREAQLQAHLHSLASLAGPSVGLFIAHDGEPDITPLTEALWERGQTVALPVVDDGADGAMQFRTWHRGVGLVQGRYGIPAPPRDQSEPVTPTAVLVSLTAFDSRGNRMGRGGGYFDRYLASASCEIVGVAFECQRVPTVPTQSHDIAMPTMVTDLGVRFIA